MLWPSAYTMPTVDDAKSRDLGKWTIPGSGILPGACRQLRHFGGSLAEPTQANEFLDPLVDDPSARPGSGPLKAHRNWTIRAAQKIVKK